MHKVLIKMLLLTKQSFKLIMLHLIKYLPSFQIKMMVKTFSSLLMTIKKMILLLKLKLKYLEM